jgi:hypothetical protein
VLRALRAKGYWVAGGFAALLAGMMVLYIGPWNKPATVGHGRPPDDRPKQLAAEQRQMAAGWCKDRNWDECEKALDRAARLDREGDRAADVAALREAIAAGRRGMGAADAGGTSGGSGAPKEGKGR